MARGSGVGGRREGRPAGRGSRSSRSTSSIPAGMLDWSRRRRSRISALGMREDLGRGRRAEHDHSVVLPLDPAGVDGAVFGRDDDAGVLVGDDLRRLHDRLQDVPGAQAAGDARPGRGRRVPPSPSDRWHWMQPGVAEELPARVPRAARRRPVRAGGPGRPSARPGRTPARASAAAIQSRKSSTARSSTRLETSGGIWPRPRRERRWSEDRAVRGAGRDEHRVGDPEGVVLRPGAEEPHLLPRACRGPAPSSSCRRRPRRGRPSSSRAGRCGHAVSRSADSSPGSTSLSSSLRRLRERGRRRGRCGPGRGAGCRGPRRSRGPGSTATR